MNTKLWSVLNLIGFALAITANALANALPLNGLTTGELSDMYPNLFVPAGFTFAIWGLIYLWLALLLGYGLYTSFSDNGAKSGWVAQMGPWFLLNTLFNASWIFAWHYQYIEIALLIMGGILVSLIMLHLRLRIGEEPASTAVKLLAHAPISVYLGWITIATVANVTTLLVDYDFSGWGIAPWIWTAIVLAVATAITLLMQARKGDYFHSAVALWAFYGIFSKRMADETPIDALLIVIGVLAAIILLSAILQWTMKGLYRSKMLYQTKIV